MIDQDMPRESHSDFSSLTVAGVLSTFNISKAVDQEGSLIETEVKYKTGLVW